MPNYANGKIYVIRSHQTEQIYIGSTTQTLAQRLGKHRSSYKLYKKKGDRRYVSSFDILQYDDHYIELLEPCGCTCKEELLRREGQLIRANNCVNKRIAGRTGKEYYLENKEEFAERSKLYNNENKEKICEYQKQYHRDNKEKNCQRVKRYTLDNKEKVDEYQKNYRLNNKEKIAARDKKYRENNKEKIAENRERYHQLNRDRELEKMKQRYQNNKENIAEKRREKITCECGSNIRKSEISRHRKSKKHLRFLGLINAT